MGVFSGPPKSFELHRNSPFASTLKSLISNRLFLLCPHYDDDDLAEYITVLVCNGKNQNQAKDDLEAFLGKKSREFVSWLWNLLLEELQSTTIISSDQKISHNPQATDRENEDMNDNTRDLHNKGNGEPDDLMGEDGEVYCSSSKSRQSSDIITSIDHRPPPSKGTVTRTVPSSVIPSKISNSDSLMKLPSSAGKYYAKSTANLEKPALLGRRPASLPQRITPSRMHSSRGGKLSECSKMHYASNALKRSLPPRPLVPAPHNDKARQSVWDRLGRKPRQDAPSRGQIFDSRVIDKRGLTKDRGDLCSTRNPNAKPDAQVGRLPPLLLIPTDFYRSSLREVCQIAQEGVDKLDGIMGVDHVDKTTSQVLSMSNIRRKRHFGEITDSGTAAGKTVDNQSEKDFQAHKRPEVPLKDSQAVVSQVHDVKQRLCQIEIEMAKLRSKQIEMAKDGIGKNNLLMNPDVVKPTEEDVESRTILVTNVHHKATKETLSMFFGKCGAVVNVVILNDDIPLAPQRSAYVTFESKASADKALTFSGTTFYSRTITVSKKGEMATVPSAPPQLTGKRLLIHASQSKSNLNSDTSPFLGSHLQWRRESLTPTQSEPSVKNTDEAEAAFKSEFPQELSAEPVSETVGDT